MITKHDWHSKRWYCMLQELVFLFFRTLLTASAREHTGIECLLHCIHRLKPQCSLPNVFTMSGWGYVFTALLKPTNRLRAFRTFEAPGSRMPLLETNWSTAQTWASALKTWPSVTLEVYSGHKDALLLTQQFVGAWHWLGVGRCTGVTHLGAPP